MERITFQNSRAKTLVGNLYPTNPLHKNALVIMTHGLINDKSSQGKFEIYADKLVSAGIPLLTFDFGGCGESDDEDISIEKEIDDLRSVILSMRALGFRNIGLYGHSFGSLICLKLYGNSRDIAPDIVTMALTGAFAGPVHFKWDEIFNSDQMQQLLETGMISTEAKSKYRALVSIHGQTLSDIALTDQRQLLSSIKCPVLIIHGDADSDEKTLYQVSQAGINYLPPGSELQLISGATHNFWNYEEQIANMLSAWFSKYLKTTSN